MSVISQPAQPAQSSYFRNAIKIGSVITGIAACALGMTILWCSVGEIGPSNNLCYIDTSQAENAPFQGLQVVAVAAVPMFQVMGVIGNLAANAHVGREQQQVERNQLKLEEFQNCQEILLQTVQSQSECLVPVQNQTRRSLVSDRDLASNLRLGEEILFETVQDIRFSENNLPRSQRIIEERAKKQGVSPDGSSAFSSIKTFSCTSQTRSMAFKEMEKVGGGMFAYMKTLAQHATNTHIGNCGEMAAVAFFKALEKGVWNGIVDIASITNGDHAFLIIGRAPNSDPNDYKTWGASAVVVDAWSKKVYRIGDLEANLEDYFGIDLSTGKPKLRPFDPQAQGLEVILTSSISIQELSDDRVIQFMETFLEGGLRRLIEEIRQSLDLFHKSQDLGAKLEAAKDLSKLLRQPEMADIDIIDSLRDPIDHFIELNNQ